MLFIFLGILVLSLAWAVRSMRDFITPYNIDAFLKKVHLKGSIVFLQGKVKHFIVPQKEETVENVSEQEESRKENTRLREGKSEGLSE